MCSRGVATIVLLGSVFRSTTANPQQDADIVNYAPVTFCELIRHPKEYDGKSVAVWATYRYGFEWQELFCLKCLDGGRTWLEFEVEPASEVRRALAAAPPDQGTLNATFRGTFRGTNGPFGDGGYVFRFDVKGIKAVEVVSKKGWAPERLAAGERQRLCKGESENPP